MSYREYCDLCRGEFDDDNLTECAGCGRWFCYGCGDCGGKRCSRCLSGDPPKQAEGAGNRMERTSVRSYLAGMVTGAGLALFVLYVASHAVPITLVGWPRIAVGGVGIVLWVGGGLLQRKLAATKERAEAGASAPPGR